MKVTLTPSKSFEFKVNEENFGEFKVDSEWEGMTKLVGLRGSFIIVSGMAKHPFEGMFAHIFGQKVEDREVTVVAASCDLWEQINRMRGGEVGGNRVYLCREIGEGDWRVCSKAEYETNRLSPEWDTAKRLASQVAFYVRRHHSLDWDKVNFEQYQWARDDNKWETKLELLYA